MTIIDRMGAQTVKEPKGGAAVAAVAILVLILFPLLYVASVRPVVWLADRDLLLAEPGAAHRCALPAADGCCKQLFHRPSSGARMVHRILSRSTDDRL